MSNVRLYFASPCWAAYASWSEAVAKGVEGSQAVTRPSAFVVAVNLSGVADVEVEVVVEVEVEVGLCRVRVTGIEVAGRPRVVSSTWHVMGGLGAGVDIVDVDMGGRRCVDRAEMRVVGDEEGMRRRRLICAEYRRFVLEFVGDCVFVWFGVTSLDRLRARLTVWW